MSLFCISPWAVYFIGAGLAVVGLFAWLMLRKKPAGILEAVFSSGVLALILFGVGFVAWLLIGGWAHRYIGPGCDPGGGKTRNYRL